MLLIEQKQTNIPDLQGLEKDTVVLNWEERRKSRQRVRTPKGTELAIALPTGTILRDGDILYVDHLGYIVVEAAKEDLIVIHPESLTQGALVAYEIGNRHGPVSINEGRIVTPKNASLEELFQKSGIRYQLEKAVFEPTPKVHAHG